MPDLVRSRILNGILLAVAGCTTPGTIHPTGDYDAFRNRQEVTIRGYNADAMEPFITPDGRYLLFNNSNDPSVDTDLHYAERVDGLTYEYRGEIRGANSAALDAVPSVDRDGTFYFISTRSYGTTRSTIYRGQFSEGTVAAVQLLPDISKRKPGHVNFDVEVSPDGTTLYFTDGVFGAGPVPKAADLAVAIRRGGQFRRLNGSATLLKNINSPGLEYAAAIAADGRELFFTRMSKGWPSIYRAVRPDLDSPFGPPARVRAIEGFAEAPALSPDGRALYYHAKEGRRFVIYRVNR